MDRDPQSTTLLPIDPLTSTLELYLASQQHSKDWFVHSLLPRHQLYHQPQHCTQHHSWDRWTPYQQENPFNATFSRTTYLAPPLALLNHEHTSCEKQSCVYTLPSAVPEQPAPQRPLQLYLWSMLGTSLKDMRGCIAYSPPFTLFAPKLLPTTPVQRHDWPAALVHDAVAVAPTLRQDIARLSRAGDAETPIVKRAVRQRLRRYMLGYGFVSGGLSALVMTALLIVSQGLSRCYEREPNGGNKISYGLLQWRFNSDLHSSN